MLSDDTQQTTSNKMLSDLILSVARLVVRGEHPVHSATCFMVLPDSRRILLKQNTFSLFLHNTNWMMNLCSNQLSSILFSNSRAISDYLAATC
jgi:hypothetical protein